MPDDSSENFRHAQQGHAEFIRFTRNLGQATGASPAQIRSRFRGFINTQLEEQRKITPSPPVSTTLPPLPTDPNIGPEMKFEPRPFQNNVADRPADAAPSTTILLRNVIYFDTSDDTFYYTDVYINGRKDAV